MYSNEKSLTHYRYTHIPIDTMESRLRYCRLQAGLSGDEVAEKMSIHKGYYWKLEKCCERVNPIHLIEFCAATDSDLAFILYGNANEKTTLRILPLNGDTIGAKIRCFRKLMGLSIREMNRQCGLPLRSASISAWEREKYVPELKSLKMLADAFRINVISFLPAQKSKL